ncbi:hypothetical protein KI387_018732, partial [Taxus chinensis]
MHLAMWLGSHPLLPGALRPTVVVEVALSVAHSVGLAVPLAVSLRGGASLPCYELVTKVGDPPCQVT